MSTSALADTITALSTNSNHLDKPESLQLEAKMQGFQSTGISAIDKLPMDGWGPVTHHHTRKETLLPNKGTIKAPEVTVPPKEQAHSPIYDVLKSLAGRGLSSKISIRWKGKSKGQCKDKLQATLGIHISHREHLGPTNMPSHSGKITWNNLAKALQRCLKENSNQRNNPAMAPNRMKWH